MSEHSRQIIALGGSGFRQPDSRTINQYILNQASAQTPKICFVGTASGDSPGYIESFYQGMATLDCEPSHLPFFGRTPSLRDTLLTQDVIYVGGGNPKSMFAVWREWGMVDVLREAYERGIILAGVSAGAICWFEQAITDSWAGDLRVIDGLGWLAGSACPHYNSEPDRRPSFLQMVKDGRAGDGYAIDDAVGIHFIDDEPARFIASKAACSAYWVTKQSDGTVAEIDLRADQLPHLWK